MSLPPPPNPSKRPIPRLGPPSQLSSRQAANRQRVSRACVSCRTRKVKCDGDQPSCKTCRDQSLACVYTGSRKDRLKDAASCNQRMAGLLRELRAHARDAKQREIDDLLDQVAQNNADDLMSTRSLSRSPHVQFNHQRADWPRPPEQGSEDDDFDSTDQDLPDSYSPPAIGHFGKHSEIHLLRRLHQSSFDAQNTQPTGGMSRTSSDEVVTQGQLTDYNFHLDGEDLELDMFVDPFQLPPYEVARTLLDGYMDTVQDTFPILDKAELVADVSLFYNSLSNPVPMVISEKTRAIWNLVFAIGAICTYPIMPEAPPGTALGHLAYHSRACILTQRGPWWCLQFDLPHVQMMGLFSLYYLAVARINRSWLASGMAMRSGYALGLHLRNTEPAVPAVQKEIRTRMWWGLYSLETTLCAITGRSSAGAEQYCSIAMPLPLPVHGLEESDVTLKHAQIRIRRNSSSQSTEAVAENRFPECSPQEHEPLNCGSYLKSTVRLNMITTATLSQLYSANTATKQRESFQASMVQLLSRVEACISTLPNGLDVRALNPTATLSREQISLALHYYSTVILISRPCLYRFVRQTSSRTPAEGEFIKKTAQVCIRAAKAIANLIPNILRHIEGDVTQSWHRKSPWWSMVHFIMQATTTLLLELSYTAVETLSDREETIACLKGLIRSLQVVELSNDSAKRAYIVAFNVFQSIARNVSVDISDLQTEVAARFEYQCPHFEFHPGLQHLDVRDQIPSGIYGHGVPGADIEHLAWEQGAGNQGYTGLLTQMSQYHAPPHPPTCDEQVLLSPDVGTFGPYHFITDFPVGFPPT